MAPSPHTAYGLVSTLGKVINGILRDTAAIKANIMEMTLRLTNMASYLASCFHYWRMR